MRYRIEIEDESRASARFHDRDDKSNITVNPGVRLRSCKDGEEDIIKYHDRKNIKGNTIIIFTKNEQQSSCKMIDETDCDPRKLARAFGYDAIREKKAIYNSYLPSIDDDIDLIYDFLDEMIFPRKLSDIKISARNHVKVIPGIVPRKSKGNIALPLPQSQPYSKLVATPSLPKSKSPSKSKPPLPKSKSPSKAYLHDIDDIDYDDDNDDDVDDGDEDEDEDEVQEFRKITPKTSRLLEEANKSIPDSILNYQLISDENHLRTDFFQSLGKIHPENSYLYNLLGCTKTEPNANTKLNDENTPSYKVKHIINCEISKYKSRCFIVTDTDKLNTSKEILKIQPNVTIIVIERCNKVFKKQIMNIKDLKTRFKKANIIHIHSDIHVAIKYLSHIESPINIFEATIYFDIYDGEPDRSIDPLLVENKINCYYCHSSNNPSSFMTQIGTNYYKKLSNIGKLYSKLDNLSIKLGKTENVAINYTCPGGKKKMLFYNLNHRVPQ